MKRSLKSAGTEPGATAVMIADVPPSIAAYVRTRTGDVCSAVDCLTAALRTYRLWIPIVGSLAEQARLAPCRFGATLLLRREHDEAISAKILADDWAVVLRDTGVSVDLKVSSQLIAISLDGKPLSKIVDIPFLDHELKIVGHEMLVGYTRFHCR